jgi:hypothetical protein
VGFLRKAIFILLLFPSLAFGALVPAIEVRSDGNSPETTVDVGEEVYLSASGTTWAEDTNSMLQFARFEWDFGDGYSCKYGTGVPGDTEMCSGIAVSHFYMTPGTYTVTLSVKVFNYFDMLGYPKAGLYTGNVFYIGSNKARVAHPAMPYTISGTDYTLAENTVGIALGDDQMPTNYWGSVALDIAADGVVDVIEATNNATGWASSTAALAALDSQTPEAGHVRIGKITAMRAGTPTGFKFGTTEFDAEHVYYEFKPTTKHTVKYGEFYYTVGETQYHTTVNDVGIVPGNDVIPTTCNSNAGCYGAVAFEVGADAVVDVIEASNNATGYNTKALSLAGIPAVSENHVRMGTLSVKSTPSYPFTFGKSHLYNSSVYPSGTEYSFTSVESESAVSGTTTATITVEGTKPIDGFEIQTANLNNRTKQYLYIQIPSAYQAGTTQLKLALIDTTDDPDTTTVLLQKSGLLSEETYLFDHTTLTTGHNYILQAQLLDASNVQITSGSEGGIWREKFTHSVATPTVSIDENNSFVVGGELFFPISGFQRYSTQFAEYISKGGCNVFKTHQASTLTAATWGTYVDAANSSSVKAWGPVASSSAGYYVDYKGKNYGANHWKRNHDVDVMSTYISTAKDKAGLFAWAWQDEPNMGGTEDKVYMPIINAWSYLVKNADANHPHGSGYVGSTWSRTAISPSPYDYLGSDDWMGGKKRVQDILGFDKYWKTERDDSDLNFSDVGPFAAWMEMGNRARTANKNLVPFIGLVQPCRGLTPGDDYLITNDEVYMELWGHTINGAKGITYFNYFDMANTARWDAMKKFADLMNSGSPKMKDIILLAPSSRTVTHNSNVHLNRVYATARDYGGDLWIFAVRATEPDPTTASKYTGTEGDSITTTFTVQNLLATDTVTKFGEGTAVAAENVHDGYFVDTFSKNQVHIYKITSSAPAVDTTAPVVTAFIIPSTYGSTTVPITLFTATDAVGVTHYLVNQTATTPAGDDAGWNATKQTTVTVAGTGAQTVYAWAKDAAGNISASASDSVTVSTPSFDVSLSVGTGCVVVPNSTQSVASGSTASFAVTTAVGYEIDGVTGCGGTWSSSPYETGAITENCTVTFSCTPETNTYWLAVSTDGTGTGTIVSEKIACVANTGTCSAEYDAGTTSHINVNCTDGYFDHWSGDECTTANCDLVMNDDKELVATCTKSVVPLTGTGSISIGAPGAGKGTIYFANYVAPSGMTGTNNISAATTVGLSIGRSDCWSVSASATGTLTTAYIHHADTNTASAKVCVYSNDGDSPDAGDSKLGCSSAITPSTIGWSSAAMSGGSVSTGTSYYLCVFTDDDNTKYFRMSQTDAAPTSSVYYRTDGDFFDTEDADLYYAGSGWNIDTLRTAHRSVYVTIE